MHSRNDLAVEALQQLLELCTHHGGIRAVLVLAEADSEDLVAFLARQVVEAFVETR
ncbi:hypothetical protein D3C81_2337980 [compost metagenome]